MVAMRPETVEVFYDHLQTVGRLNENGEPSSVNVMAFAEECRRARQIGSDSTNRELSYCVVQ